PVATGDPDVPLAFNETAEAGVYTLLDPARPDARRAFAVNLASDESDLEYLDDVLAGPDVAGAPAVDRKAKVEAGLKELLPGRPSITYVDDPSRAADQARSARRGVKAWDVVLAVVLGIALFEPWFANRISQRHYAPPPAGARPPGAPR
ncbi:MAG TPA: hypothetical protein VG406_14065, partial [Isosphaeraceae bacterium]|nr:hypothetical protein [Isosphaeraceae bacterium]